MNICRRITTRRRLFASFALLGSTLPLIIADRASAVVTNESNPLVLANALAAAPGIVTGASFIAQTGATAALVSGVAGFPTNGSNAILLSTGNPQILENPNNDESSGTDLGGPNVRGNTDFDVTILKIYLNIPAEINCMTGMDFRFLSEEYPEFVGSDFNDAFIAEFDSSTWSTSGSVISDPNNFAFDPIGNEISVNATGSASVNPGNAVGTTFDAATGLLTVASPITPGAHSLYLSIFDQGDGIFDSVVILDNLRFGTVSNISECTAGLVPGGPGGTVPTVPGYNFSLSFPKLTTTSVSTTALPRTGSDSGNLLAITSVIVLTGAALVLARRRLVKL